MNPSSPSKVWEQLWSRKIRENSFEICCIPFFLYDLSLGDEVMTNQDYWILEVTKPSGHFTFRVWFEESIDVQIRKELVGKINKFGCLYEIYSKRLMAIDAVNGKVAQKLADYLSEKERLGWIHYETGKT